MATTAQTTAQPVPVLKAKKWTRERYVRFGINRFLDFLMVIMLCFSLGPIFWMVNSSLKTNTEILNNNVWPETPRFKNYIDLWDRVNFDRIVCNQSPCLHHGNRYCNGGQHDGWLCPGSL